MMRPDPRREAPALADVLLDEILALLTHPSEPIVLTAIEAQFPK